MMRSCWIVGILFSCFLSVLARNPGFKARVTSKGLNYANDVALEALKASVKSLQIPDQRGNHGKIKYEITSIRVVDFKPPASTIDIDAGRGLYWQLSNAYIAVHGDFHYKALFISDDGSFDADVSGVSLKLTMDIGEDTSGRPSISASGCSSDVNNVNFHFKGGASWLYNLFRHKVGDIIKDTLKKQLCTLVNKEINEDGEKKLAKIKVTTPLGKQFLLDYRLVHNPAFQTGYLETYHKGEIFWLDEATTEAPMVPPNMPESADTGSMLYLWVSDYIFDTIGYQAQKHGVLMYNLTQNDLPADNRGVLNTTCEGFIPKCVGGLIPQIGEKYPRQVVELRMNSTIAPTMKITSAGVGLNFAGLIDLYANKPGLPSSSSKFLLTLDATMTTTVTVSVQNEMVYAQIKDLNIKLKVGKSAVGTVSDAFLDFLVKEALKVYLVPQLNDLGKRGFPLPVTGDFKLENTKISFVQDTIIIGTDLKYTPSRLDLVDDLTGPLKFKPHVELNMI